MRLGVDHRVDGAHDNLGHLIFEEVAVAYLCRSTVQDEVDRTSQPLGGQVATEGPLGLSSPEQTRSSVPQWPWLSSTAPRSP